MNDIDGKNPTFRTGRWRKIILEIKWRGDHGRRKGNNSTGEIGIRKKQDRAEIVRQSGPV